MTKLDEMIKADLKEYYLNPEGDYVLEYTDLLADDYAMDSEHWHNVIKSTVNPTWYVSGKGTQPIYEHTELSEEDLQSIVGGILEGDGLYEIKISYTLCRRPTNTIAAYAIGELEIQLPEGLESYESDKYRIKKSSDGIHDATVNTDAVITFVLDRDQIIEFLDDQSEAA